MYATMKKFAPVLILFLFSACKKLDETAPVIQLDTPIDAQVFVTGETVTIKAKVTDETGIHMVHAMVLDNDNYSHIMHFEEHFDGKTYKLIQTFVTEAGRNYYIEVGATDHADNSSKKTIVVSTN
jgi:hypothetical protein